METHKAWKKLSSVDCSSHIEKKGNLSYLSWAWAWATLCDNYPESTFEFEKTDTGSEFWSMPDGSGEVRCSLTVDGITRTCWLPVMDYKNKAISNPNARDVNDTKMRCLVKAIALFGLGLYIYAGEDIPSMSSPDDPFGMPKPTTGKAVCLFVPDTAGLPDLAGKRISELPKEDLIRLAEKATTEEWQKAIADAMSRAVARGTEKVIVAPEVSDEDASGW